MHRIMFILLNLSVIVIVIKSIHWREKAGKIAIRQAGLENAVFKACKVHRNLVISFVSFYLLAGLFLAPSVAHFLAVATGLAVIAGLRIWHYPVLLKNKYVLLCYVAQAGLGIGYLAVPLINN